MAPSGKTLKPALTHRHAPSLETNASAIAESTISLGQISRFPEPPSSIPNSPMRSAFDTPPIPSTPTSRHQPRRLPNPPPTSYAHSAHPGPSFKPPPQSLQNPPPYSAGTSQLSKSTPTLSAHDWHDGASTIDVDGTEDRLLPTSLITSLLQENKLKRNSNATSFAFSGISEITYPPVAEDSITVTPSTPGFTDRLLPNVGRQRDNTSLPDHSHPTSKRISGAESDCETLASMGNYPVQLMHSAPAGYRFSGPGLSTISSIGQSSNQDSDTIRSTDRLFHNKLPTTYEHSDEFPDHRSYGAERQEPAFLFKEPVLNRAVDPKVDSRRRSKSSFHSSKSTGTILSRLSNGLSLRRAFGGGRKHKPLPPLPLMPNVPLAEEQAYRKLEESSPLPDLIHRAGALHTMLENGHRPHSVPSTPAPTSFPNAPFHPSSQQSYYTTFKPPNTPEIQEVKEGSIRLPLGVTVPNPFSFRTPASSGHHQSSANLRKPRKLWILIGFGVLLVLAVVGIVVGIVVGKRNNIPRYNCPGTMTGSACNLDVACVCTSTGQCNPLAQSVINLLPAVNDIFKANYTAALAYQSFWLTQGDSSSGSCASQAEVMDVGKGFDQISFPNRTRWLQAALLWNTLQTMDTPTSRKMQSFVQSLPWKSLNSGDSPSTDKGSSFSMTAAGFTYDFAAQTVTQPPATFVTQGQPSNAQIKKVSSNAQATLDRIYTFAQASSNQRTSALQRYWTSVLQQRPDSLAIFKSALRVSPVLLPFNASSTPLRNLYTLSPTSPFPPPLSCHPGLDPVAQQQLNSFENAVFSLPNVKSASQFDPACFPDRPIYGVLDILQLRLPFPDGLLGVAQQAARLDSSAGPRIVIYSREAFNNKPAGSVALSSSQLDPSRYGTFNFFDHVVLQYLNSIPDISTANALVNFVLQQATGQKTPTPPDASSILLAALDRLPVLEVAVFGEVSPPDLSAVVSPFTTPSGALFFGSDDGAALRNWTINTVQKAIVWTQNATSPTVLRDKSLDSDNIISQTWSAASAAGNQRATNVGLANVTNSLGPQFTP